ncbi:MAG TPA: RibD family protein, partial [Patescibacteria group bacterium]
MKLKINKYINNSDLTIQKVFTTKKRPFVAIQFGVSLDGKIATRTGDSKWINNEDAREFSRKLRSKYQAILVGINTVIADNPHLGVRIKGLKDPLRIILDPKLRIPLDSKVLRDSNVLIITTKQAENEKLNVLQKKGIEYIVFNTQTIQIKELLNKL